MSCFENYATFFHFRLEIIFIHAYLASVKIIIEKHPDGYVAYPAGIQGVVVGEGDTFDEALHDVQSAIRFHIKTFGRESLELENPAVDAFVAEAVV
jgi:predicted RNase H-like HicB family nuclease